MSAESIRAVFLSYASQNAEAAQRIAKALRGAGVEVWLDQSELVGGDAWDQKIRGQIKACALFVPLISAATQARREGYFRRLLRRRHARRTALGARQGRRAQGHLAHVRSRVSRFGEAAQSETNRCRA